MHGTFNAFVSTISCVATISSIFVVDSAKRSLKLLSNRFPYPFVHSASLASFVFLTLLLDESASDLLSSIFV